MQFFHCQIIFQHRLIQKRGQQSGSCFLILFQIKVQLFLSCIFLQKKTQIFLYSGIFLLLNGKHRFQRLNHSASVILFHPGRKGDQLCLNLHAVPGYVCDLLDF